VSDYLSVISLRTNAHDFNITMNVIFLYYLVRITLVSDHP